MLKLISISKRYINVKALEAVDFELSEGEIHALIGPNGAGKSTLMKILTGIVNPDEGNIEINRMPVQIRSIQDAQRLGIAMLQQDPILVPDLSVYENIFLGIEPSLAGLIPRTRYMKAESKRLMKMLGFPVHPNTMVRDLTYSQQSIVAIAKAMAVRSKILIMDEPTSYLSSVESMRLFDILRKLKEQGVSIVFITHRIKEVMEYCDRVTILRDGCRVLTSDVRGLTHERVVQMMLGHKPHEHFPPVLDTKGAKLIEVRELTRRPYFHNVNLELHKGEILGVAGLIGSGKSELARALFGQDKDVSGTIFWKGQQVEYKHILSSHVFRFGLVNQNRIEEGLFMDMGVTKNLTIAALNKMKRRQLIDANLELDAALDTVIDLDIKVEHMNQNVRFLSGGSQQKVLLGKWLVSDCDLYLLDEPTRGVDMGSKEEIYSAIHGIAQEGKGVIIFSSDVSELLMMCTRIAVMNKGTIVAEMHHSSATEEKLIYCATGSEVSL